MTTNNYLFFRKQGNIHVADNLPEGISIKKRIPQPYGKGMESMLIGRKRFFYFLFHTILKHPFSSKFIEYDLIDQDGVAAKAVLISKVPIYAFLPENGIHICFCETVKSKRGKGYYPLLLAAILRDKPDEEFFMIANEVNIASINGIKHAGFVMYAKGVKDTNGVFRLSE